MESSNKDSSNIYSPSYSNKDPGMNVPVHSQQNLAPLSPYLNFDPVYLPQSQPEFIFPEGAGRQRGRFELAFSQIGGSCMIGAGVGGLGGFYNGLRSTTLAGHTGKLRRTQLLNHVMKQGAATANTLGVLAVMYSGFGVILSWARGVDDELNTLTAATTTGLLYKSSAGLRKCAIGGGIGFGLASVYCLWTARDRLQDFRQNYSPALRNGEVAVVKPQNENPEMTTPICQCWTMVALLGITIGLLILAAAIILTDGYVKTCNEYRKTLVKTLPTTGLATKVIYNRLSCSSILDFMDYLEPTTRPFRRRENFDYSRPYEERDFTRGDFINTAASLLLAIFTSWINCALWGLIVIHNFVLAKLARSRNTGI